ncbi:hypothetical protein KLK06_33085 [Nonomuraea sp. NEAU-A123]|nr:hypothetical protein [Nonomuraea sp. NEAU-A123]MBT2230687.1 hypothetical protein [Nonomuraea sp. NEAU-A123]
MVEPRLRPTTHRAYRDHVGLYLVPYLGRIKLTELSRRDVTRMFVALGRRRNRYGEVAGLRWVDVDLERRESTVAHQLVHTDDGLVLCEPKSTASRRTVALDPESVRLLRR